MLGFLATSARCFFLFGTSQICINDALEQGSIEEDFLHAEVCFCNVYVCYVWVSAYDRVNHLPATCNNVVTQEAP
jgi:hypothetical protein